MADPPSPSVSCVLANASEYGASPFWNRATGHWHWLDVEDRRFFQYAPDKDQVDSWPLPSRPGACAPCRSGAVLLVLEDGLYTLDLRYGALDPLKSLEQYREVNLFSAGHLDRHGRFWCTSAHLLRKLPTGKLYRLHPDLQVFVETEAVEDCRGIDWSLDGTTAYLTNSLRRTVETFRCDPATGRIGPRKPFIAFRKGEGYPAGLTVTQDGSIWVCHYGGSCISRWSTTGKRLETIPLPVPYVTGCAAGGAKRDELWITTARREVPGLPPASGSIYSLRLTDTTGVNHRVFDA